MNGVLAVESDGAVIRIPFPPVVAVQSESISRRTLALATGGTVAFLVLVAVCVLLISPGSDADSSTTQPVARVVPSTSTTLSGTDFAGDEFGPRAKAKAEDEAPIALLARLLGLPKDEVRQAISQHRALAPLSTKPGVTAQGLIDALMARPKRVLALQVAAGTMTQDAANLHLIQYLSRYSLMVNGTLPATTTTTAPAGTKTTTTVAGGGSGITLKPGTKIPGLKLPPGTKIPGLKLPPGTPLPPGSITLK